MMPDDRRCRFLSEVLTLISDYLKSVCHARRVDAGLRHILVHILTSVYTCSFRAYS